MTLHILYGSTYTRTYRREHGLTHPSWHACEWVYLFVELFSCAPDLLSEPSDHGGRRAIPAQSPSHTPTKVRRQHWRRTGTLLTEALVDTCFYIVQLYIHDACFQKGHELGVS